jgi:hypothetical protein
MQETLSTEDLDTVRASLVTPAESLENSESDDAAVVASRGGIEAQLFLSCPVILS